MIVVTGATGQLGSAVIQNLIRRLPTERIRASVRNPNKAGNLEREGIAVRHGDFADAGSLDEAFAGAGQVLIVSADKLGEEALALHRTAIEAARRAGARRILYTSHMGARADSPFPPAAQHWGTEQDLGLSGVPFTALRHGFYAESCLQMIGDGLKTGDLRTPADGPVSWTARADLAAGDAAILASGGEWDGVTPPLTASAAVTMADIASIASEVLGREVRHTFIRDDEWVEATVLTGTPRVYAEMLLGTFQAARRGDFAATSPALGRLLDREPQTIRAVIEASVATTPENAA